MHSYASCRDFNPVPPCNFTKSLIKATHLHRVQRLCERLVEADPPPSDTGNLQKATVVHILQQVHDDLRDHIVEDDCLRADCLKAL